MEKDARKALKEKIVTAIHKVLKNIKSDTSNKTEKKIMKYAKKIVKTIRNKDVVI